MSAFRFTGARAFIGCDLHDAEGLSLVDDEVVPMRELGQVVSVDFTIEPLDDVIFGGSILHSVLTPENDSP